MKLTAPLLEAFLKCPTKCFLLAHEEVPTGNVFADWVRREREAHRAEGVQRLQAQFANSECVKGTLDLQELKHGNWRLAVDVPIEVEEMRSSLHALESVPSIAGKPSEFRPIRLISANRPTSTDKLLLAFDALVLSRMTGYVITLGRIICGDEQVSHRIKIPVLMHELCNATEKATKLLSGNSAPELVLNHHCAECEFQARCRKKAVEIDDLSLFTGMKPGERDRHRRRGIFTVNQLSCTFRPRRQPKKSKPSAQPHYFALQALAIRENTVYINGSLELPQAEACVFLDIEGLSSSGPYYLVGALISSNGKTDFHSFWADGPSGELKIFIEFIEIVSALPNFRVFHFGRYDAAAMKIVSHRLPKDLQPKAEVLLQKATNVLSLVYSQIYFPTYSNGLKELGRFLGCERTTEHLSGPQSIVARKSWERDQNPVLKSDLIRYNKEDCFALKRLCEFISNLSHPGSNGVLTEKFLRAEEIKPDAGEYCVSFAEKKYALDDLHYVNKCAYFDYQREKVIFRTHPHLRPRKKSHGRIEKEKLSPNKIVTVESERCPTCRSKRIRQKNQVQYFVVDLKFSKAGVRRFVTQFSSWNYWCLKCRYPFTSRGRRGTGITLGRSLLVWCVYCNISCCQSLGQIGRSCQDLFGIPLQPPNVSRARRRLSVEFRPLYEEILNGLLQSPVLHADETRVHLVGQSAYVWVLTSLDKCYFLFRPNREGEFLKEMLKPFAGVLVSDFFGAYDSLACFQQKCLVHFVRDIDDDLLKNPLDSELKTIAQEFGTILKDIIQTVDRYGLKKWHLHRHKKEVTKFLASVASRKFLSEPATSYQKRFEKSGAKMFTFLDHDGIPWNNNSAEHAIKRFAKYRRTFDGYFTEDSLQEYLVLASVFVTCEFNNVGVLRFLLSRENTLEGLLGLARRRAPVAQQENVASIQA